MKKFLLSLLSATLLFGVSNGQIITTIAGNGSAGYSGDGGAATAAKINYPYGLAIDTTGNIYIADHGNNRVRKINTAGYISTIAGNGSGGYGGDGGAATAAQLNYPSGIAVDGAGNVYIAEVNNNRIRKVNSAGIISTVAGNGSGGFSGDGGSATAARINTPYGVAVDGAGNIYIADAGNNRVRFINSSGIISTFAGTGSGSFSGDGGPATAAGVQPYAIAVDGAGNAYIGETHSYRVRKINTSGIITTIAGTGSSGYSGDGGPATAAQFYYPEGMAIDAMGNIYVADNYNCRIRKIDPSGIITTCVGTSTCGYSGDGGSATAAQIRNSDGVVVDGLGNLFLTESGNNTVRKVTCASTYTSDSFKIYLNKFCSGPQIKILPHHYSSGMYVKSYFGDGDTDSTVVSSSGLALINHVYNDNGTYTIKQVLHNAGATIDSFSFRYNHLLCNSFSTRFYYDANSNCINDTSDDVISQPVTVEVDSNGVAIDTISCTSGLYYTAYGVIGDVYGFKVISTPAGLHVTCPYTGIIYDTLGSSILSAPPKYMGLECSTSSGYDLSVNAVIPVTGFQDQIGDIYVQNSYCLPVSATVTLHYSPKYTGSPADIYPSPSSISGNSIVWNLSSLIATAAAPYHLHYQAWKGSTALTIGDTVHTYFSVTPDSGDADTSNNTEVIIDTVRAGCDPNEMWVKPAGCIASGTTPTQLTYTINFENTGNDTAHNIYVMDTLSDYVDVSSMRLVMSSHEMYISKLKDAAGHNILKFDFPAINLLDSSHHGKRDGAVIFNINTKPGLATGTKINNRAGIYFDVNAVVMTNQVTNGIGCPVVNEVKTVAANNTIDIYPNPANNVLHIKLAAEKYQSFTITNSVGTSLLTGTLTGNNTQLNIQTLPAGLYFINLKGDGGNEVWRFVKW